MGLFSRKIPASEGLSLVAVSGALTVFEQLPMSSEAAQIAGLVVAHVHSKRHQFGIPDTAVDRLIEFTTAILAKQRPDLRPFSMAYMATAGVAITLYDDRTLGCVAQQLYEMSDDWSISLPQFLTVTKSFTEACDQTLLEKSSSWRFGT